MQTIPAQKHYQITTIRYPNNPNTLNLYNFKNNIQKVPTMEIYKEINKNYYYPENIENYPKQKEELYPNIREQIRKTPIPVEPQENLINQYNNNPPLSKYTPKNIKEEYTYGNEVPRTYEEYQKLIQKENERENLLKQRQSQI